MTTASDGANVRGKLNFHLTQDEDGYPPAHVEALWVIARGSAFEIDESGDLDVEVASLRHRSRGW